MKRIFCAVVGLFLSFAPKGSATEAIYNFGTFQNIVGYANGGAGFGFSTASDIQVTSLGFAQNADIAINPYTVSLWDSTGDLLASALVTSGDPSFNQSFYQAITPVTLQAGNTYFIGAGETAAGLWAGNVNDVGDFSVAPEITYLGEALGANIWQGLQANSSTILLVGPDFQYSVPTPEPSPAAFVLPFLLAFALKALPRRAIKNN
jgi:Domain of unknown function (DUF4082)